ncbi:MAG: Stk1 family PASTA domain-containing Ser/Thr kinase [Robinsoniella sp.]|nr:Stk1 family PASTA domain-containing Ser/Thr kinase [Robinsoniella sp.]
MLKEGMFIQERYEIVDRIGSGGMADVYKAKDHKLNRFVAVKVLKPEFREDTAFISKFQVEAQSAAGLSHPNIVNVYDVGDENGIDYIVMELVEGITLKEYISKKGKLAVREAISIAIQVSMGLEVAHNNSIVHRDVKPQNIMISTDGKVKVTDFGIARAASTNTINSTVMGSVHYSSPEQARGGYSDYKSDIYSLGITMYEMLTGHVPFDGDTTVSIAIKHLQEEMRSPREYVPDLPKSIVQIIYKCTQKSPDRRYNDMSELIRDLKESLINPDGDFVTIAPVDTMAKTRTITKEELEQIQNENSHRTPLEYENEGSETYSDQNYGEAGYGDQNYDPNYDPNYHDPNYHDLNYGQQNYSGGYYDQGTGQYGTANQYGYQNYNGGYQNYGENYGNGYNYQGYEEAEEPKGRRWEKILTGISIVIAVIILLIFLALAGNALGVIDFGQIKDQFFPQTTGYTGDDNNVSNLVPVPALEGKTEEEAKTVLEQSGLVPSYGGEVASDLYEAGKIVSQEPVSEASVVPGTTVTYVVSKGAELVVPDVTDDTLKEAQIELVDMGFVVVSENIYDPNVVDGCVIESNPVAGTTLGKGEIVTLKISRYNEGIQVQVKGVQGQTLDEAREDLMDSGLIVNIQKRASSSTEEGYVISQSLTPNSLVDIGSSIVLTVSTGAEVASGSESGMWKTKCQLTSPSNYNGEQVKIEIEQEGERTVVLQDTSITFPYTLEVQGKEGVTLGKAYLYIKDPLTEEYGAAVVYNNIPFSKVE